MANYRTIFSDSRGQGELEIEHFSKGEIVFSINDVRIFDDHDAQFVLDIPTAIKFSKVLRLYIAEQKSKEVSNGRG